MLVFNLLFGFLSTVVNWQQHLMVPVPSILDEIAAARAFVEADRVRFAKEHQEMVERGKNLADMMNAAKAAKDRLDREAKPPLPPKK